MRWTGGLGAGLAAGLPLAAVLAMLSSCSLLAGIDRFSATEDGGPLFVTPDGAAGDAARDSDASTEVRKPGGILVVQGLLSAEAAYPVLIAAEFADQDRNARDGCTTVLYGSCVASVCLDETTVADAGALYGAGSLVFSGTTPPVTMEPGSGNAYPVQTTVVSAPFVTEGQPVRVVATGKDVPGFVIETTPLKVPTLVQQPNPGALAIDRSADFVLTWSEPSAPGGFVFAVLKGPVPGGAATVTCTYAAAVKTGKVPKAALDSLGETANFVFGGHYQSDVGRAGPFDVRLVVQVVSVENDVAFNVR